jgi:predicted nucleotide-binding protein
LYHIAPDELRKRGNMGTERAIGSDGLFDVVALVSDFLRSQQSALDADAIETLEFANRIAPYREKDQELLTSTLLLVALAECQALSSGDRTLRVIVAPFLSSLHQWSGYRQLKDAYFTVDVGATSRDDRTVLAVRNLTKAVRRILSTAIEIERSLQRTKISASAIAAAFITAEMGVFIPRLRKIEFDRAPFRSELSRFLSDRNSEKQQENLPVGKAENKLALRTRHSVFLIHGHDISARDLVNDFLEQIGLHPIILDKQPNQGLTIIEKFERFARQVDFAVALFTPDDIAGVRSETSAVFRARQNVIFELGYFMGKMGRDKVCVLRKDQVEGFSDFQGIIYTVMDSGGEWKPKLVTEFKHAGLSLNTDVSS